MTSKQHQLHNEIVIFIKKKKLTAIKNNSYYTAIHDLSSY